MGITWKRRRSIKSIIVHRLPEIVGYGIVIAYFIWFLYRKMTGH